MQLCYVYNVKSSVKDQNSEILLLLLLTSKTKKKEQQIMYLAIEKKCQFV